MKIGVQRVKTDKINNEIRSVNMDQREQDWRRDHNSED